ncbi:hypothetical protein AAE478_007905 [Parahypoxylon ruwenzoriense]
MATPASYLIVGSGCFGASTARSLKKTYPDADVLLLDPAQFPDPAAAAHDVNKIVRAEYDDPLYMSLALEAMAAWSGSGPQSSSSPSGSGHADPVVAPFFQRTGALWSITRERTRRLKDNYEALLGPGNSPLEVLSFEDARARFPLLRDCRFAGGAEQCVLSPGAGWADAAAALGAVVRAAVEDGVRYEVAAATQLTFDDDGAVCTGVRTADGRSFAAQRVVLCAGAYTPWLLAQSAAENPGLCAGEKMLAAAVLMGLFKVPPGAEGLGRFRGAPIIVHPFGEFPAECIPPGSPRAPDLAKCTHEFPYTRKVYHGVAKQEISVPPLLSHADLMTWSRDLPDALKAKSASVREMFFGDAVKGMVPETYRLCWDLSTPDEDWIISPHPASKNLYIAAGGSFHGFKFLPIIGKYVAQMIHGELPEEHARRWAWDRKMTPVVTPYTPRGDLRDVPGYHD